MVINSLLGIFGVTYIFVGLVLIILSIPLISSKVSRNNLYGIRIGKSFESDENWYVINRYGGTVLLVVGILVSALGISYALVGDVSTMLEIILLFLPIVLIMLGCIIAYLHARNL